MNIHVRSLAETTLRPERFFLGQTSGSGLLRNVFGKVIHRFALTTRGARDGAYGGIKIDHTYAFDNGEIDVMSWLVKEAANGRYLIGDAQSARTRLAQIVDGDFSFVVHRRFTNRFGLATLRCQGRISLVEADTALSTIKLTMVGAPLGTLTGYHHRIGP
jgi:hypothetical protein